MSTIRISEDEHFPTYSFDDRGEVPVEVPAETIERWQAAIAAYDQVQDEMGEHYEAARARAEHERKVAAAEKAVQDAQAKLDALRG